MKSTEALREKLHQAGTFRLVSAFPYVILVGAAALLLCGYGLHMLLLILFQNSGPGIFVENPLASALATIALLSALILGGVFILVTLVDSGPATRRVRIAFGSLILLCVAFYAWSLRPHYRVHTDRLDIVSWLSSRSLHFAAVDDVLITSSLSARNRRSYRLRLTLADDKSVSLPMTSSGLTLVLAKLPQDMDCRTDKTPENRPGVQRELGQAFSEGMDVKGLTLPSACLAALSL